MSVSGRVSVRRTRRVAGVLPRIPAAAAEPVPLITVTVAMDGALVRAATAMGARGLVVAATGSGNTHPDVLAAATEAMGAGMPVVLATRCVSGQVSASYGFPGGGARWIAAGAIPAGSLGAPQGTHRCWPWGWVPVSMTQGCAACSRA